MADNVAKIEMTAEDKGVLAVLQKQERALDKLADKLDKVSKAGRRGGDEVKSSFGRAGAALESFGQKLLGIGSAAAAATTIMAVLKKELEDMKRRDKEAKTSQQSTAEAVRGVRMNFNEDASLKDADLEKVLQGVAQRTRTPVGTVASAFSSAASARGSLTNAQAMKAVEAALQLMPGSLETGTELGSRALDLMKLQAGASPRAAVGYLSGVQAASRVTDTARLGKHAAPAIAAMVSGGGTIEQGGELYAAISNLLQDAEGAISATAQKNLMTQLTGFVPGASGKDARGRFRIPGSQGAAFEAAGNPMARLAVLQQNPELRRDFMARNSFAAESRTAIERLLSGEAGAMNELRQAQQTVLPMGAATENIFAQRLGRAERGQFQPVLTAQQRTAQLKEQALLQNTMGGRRSAAREALLTGMDAAGLPWADRYAAEWRFDLAGGKQPVQQAITQLQGYLQTQQQVQQDGAGWGSEGYSREGAAQAIPILQKQIQILEQLRDDSRRRDPPAQRREPAAQALGRR